MPVERHLGSAWASVRGPASAEKLLVWMLEAGFRGLMPGPGTRSLDWRSIEAAAERLPVRFRAVRAMGVLGSGDATAGLASPREGDRATARSRVDAAAALARAMKAPLLVVEPGSIPMLGEGGLPEDLGDPALRAGDPRLEVVAARRKVGQDAALDRACRSVHAIVRAHPDLLICLTIGRNIASVGDLRGLACIFEDLAGLRIGYWHDAPIAARRHQVLGEPQGAWLEAFSNCLAGMTLGDSSGEGLYLAPGAGGVDYHLVASYVPRAGKAFPSVLELDPTIDALELPGIRSFLEKFGL